MSKVSAQIYSKAVQDNYAVSVRTSARLCVGLSSCHAWPEGGEACSQGAGYNLKTFVDICLGLDIELFVPGTADDKARAARAVGRYQPQHRPEFAQGC